MVTDFSLATELVSDLKTRLAAELPSIIDAISTSAIPLSHLAGLYTGFFDPIAKTVRPALFLVPDRLEPVKNEGTMSSYEAKLHVDLFFVTAKGTASDELASYQLYNYVKAIVVFINGHLDEYEVEDDIELYEALGADRNQRWAHLALAIETEIRA